MNDVNFSTFPSNRTEALTMLYLQQQNLSDLSPEELTQRYFEVFKEIRVASLTKSSRDDDGYFQINL